MVPGVLAVVGDVDGPRAPLAVGVDLGLSLTSTFGEAAAALARDAAVPCSNLDEVPLVVVGALLGVEASLFGADTEAEGLADPARPTRPDKRLPLARPSDRLCRFFSGLSGL